MCLFRKGISIRQADRTTRSIWMAGQLSLSSALCMGLFAEGFGARHPALFDGIRVLLLGLAINCIFWSMRRLRSLRS